MSEGGDLSRLTVKVLDLENTRSRLGGRTLELRRVNLDESLRVEVFSEQVTDGGGHSEDGLVGWCL